MSKLVIFIETKNGEVLKSSLSALTAAKEIASLNSISEIIPVLANESVSSVSSTISTDLITKSYFVESADLKNPTPKNLTNIIYSIIEKESASIFVAANTVIGKDIAPRIAVKMNANQLSDILSVNSDSSFDRPMYAGNVIANVSINSDNKVFTVRPTAFDPAVLSGSNSAELISDYTNSSNSEVISVDKPESSRPELADAEIVVSGGRAFASKENFEKILYPLADKLGAAIGASRAAVDSGYAPNDWQIGQTGKVVAPKLYIAIGISGAIQHLAGMKDSKVIVAINKDSEAPIFELADYGLVADLFDVVEELTSKV